MIHTLRLNVSGHFCNTWPKFQIIVNDDVIFSDEIVNTHDIELEINTKSNNLVQFELIDKLTGENGIWDTQLNDLNEIIADKFIKINSVMVADVDITTLVYNSPFIASKTNETHPAHQGSLNFNGCINLHLEEPLLKFLINAKYKQNITHEKAIYSNTTYLFHYEKEKQIIDEIMKLVNVNL